MLGNVDLYIAGSSLLYSVRLTLEKATSNLAREHRLVFQKNSTKTLTRNYRIGQLEAAACKKQLEDFTGPSKMNCFGLPKMRECHGHNLVGCWSRSTRR